MKRSAYGLRESPIAGVLASVALGLLVVGSARAGVPAPANAVESNRQAKQERMRGKKAVMHVYSYAPKTLEITSVTSRFFKDVDACESAVDGVLRTAESYARDGDQVDAQCVAVDPPEASARVEETRRPTQITEL